MGLRADGHRVSKFKSFGIPVSDCCDTSYGLSLVRH